MLRYEIFLSLQKKMRNLIIAVLFVLCLGTLTGVEADSFCGTGLMECGGMGRIRQILCGGLTMCGDKLSREKREMKTFIRR